MSPTSSIPVTLVCCTVCAAEVETLWKEHWPTLAFRRLNSMLHMRPERLAIQLETVLKEEMSRGHRVVLVYGDCCPRMTALASQPGVVRTRGHNCCELLLGRDEYRRQAREGAFFLFPEWTRRWRRVFTSELGLNHDNAAGLMGDMHRKLIYLDTGLTPVPAGDLQACADYCRLPWEARTVSLDVLRSSIQDALTQLETPGHFS